MLEEQEWKYFYDIYFRNEWQSKDSVIAKDYEEAKKKIKSTLLGTIDLTYSISHNKEVNTMLNKEEEEKKGGLYEQLKNNIPNPNIEYTREYLISMFKDVFSKDYNNPNRKLNLPLEWKHCEWEENGEKFSCWKLMAGNLFTIATTGDGGKEEFDRIMKEEFSKLPNLTK